MGKVEIIELMKKIYDQYMREKETLQLQYPCRNPTPSSKGQQGWILIDPLQKSIATQTDLPTRNVLCDAFTQIRPVTIDRAQQTDIDPQPTLSSRLVACFLKTVCCLAVNPLDS